MNAQGSSSGSGSIAQAAKSAAAAAGLDVLAAAATTTTTTAAAGEGSGSDTAMDVDDDSAAAAAPVVGGSSAPLPLQLHSDALDPALFDDGLTSAMATSPAPTGDVAAGGVTDGAGTGTSTRDGGGAGSSSKAGTAAGSAKKAAGGGTLTVLEKRKRRQQEAEREAAEKRARLAAQAADAERERAEREAGRAAMLERLRDKVAALPSEVLLMIFLHIDQPMKWQLVCRRWNGECQRGCMLSFKRMSSLGGKHLCWLLTSLSHSLRCISSAVAPTRSDKDGHLASRVPLLQIRTVRDHLPRHRSSAHLLCALAAGESTTEC